MNPSKNRDDPATLAGDGPDDMSGVMNETGCGAARMRAPHPLRRIDDDDRDCRPL